MKGKLFAAPYIVWMVLFIVAPMVLVFLYALTDSSMNLTISNILKAFGPMSMTVLLRSLWIAALATLLCLLLGYPAAYLLSKLRSSTGMVVTVLFLLPMWMNFLLRTYAWRTLLDMNGIINQFLAGIGLGPVQFLYTPGAVLFGLVYNFLPFMVLPIYTVFRKMDLSCLEAAEDLGANRLQSFWRVVLPLSRPGIVSGVIMVFMPAMTTFAITRLLGGSNTLYYGDLIENQFVLLSDWHYGSALSIVLLIIMVFSMWLFKRNDKDGEGAGLL